MNRGVADEQARAEADANIARNRLAETLVAIQARMHPRALARDALAELRETGADYARGIVTAAKDNPGPLIGIGATIVALLARDWLTNAFTALGDGDKVSAPTAETRPRLARSTSEKTNQLGKGSIDDGSPKD